MKKNEISQRSLHVKSLLGQWISWWVRFFFPWMLLSVRCLAYFSSGVSRNRNQQKSAIILVFHLPWYLLAAANAASEMSFLISGPTNTPSFSFASESRGNFKQRYRKHSPSFGRDLMNCLMRPNLMWRGGNRTLSRGTKLSWRTFFLPGLKYSRIGQSFSPSRDLGPGYPTSKGSRNIWWNRIAALIAWLEFWSLHKSSTYAHHNESSEESWPNSRFFLENNRMSNRNRSKCVAIMEKNNFYAVFWRINKQPPFSRIILEFEIFHHSVYIVTKHQIFLFAEILQKLCPAVLVCFDRLTPNRNRRSILF